MMFDSGERQRRPGAKFREYRLMRRILAGVIALGLIGSAPAWAEDVAPALLYDIGGKFDRSFNEAASLTWRTNCMREISRSTVTITAPPRSPMRLA